MQAPEFWWTDGALGRMLDPLGAFYALATKRRVARPPSFSPPVPVLSIGNLVAGGAGKTPLALAAAAWLKEQGAQPIFLSRGYGGSEVGPLRVAPSDHEPEQVGDEPLLLARIAPTWIGRDRAAAAQAALAEPSGENRVLVLDDAHQNPALRKDVSLVVVDGARGFGNLRCIPAGPLREPVGAGLRRAAGVVVLGAERESLKRFLSKSLPVVRGDLVPDAATQALAGRKVVAFAGIGRPEKVLETLRQVGARVLAFHPFADHFPYREADIQPILDEAYDLGAIAVTTEKDAVRLPPDQRPQVDILRVSVGWRSEEDADGFADLLTPLLK